MTTPEKERWFVRRMTESADHERWGYELLLKRDDFDRFFDLLSDAGLFEPSRTSGPVPGSQPGSVQIPYWWALDYLHACAKRAGSVGNAALAEKILKIVRQVSRATDEAGNFRDNYHTYRKFADILGELPLRSLQADDLDLIPIWLASRFETGLVTHALDTGLLTRLLASDAPEDWGRACIVLRHCTALRWEEDRSAGVGNKRPVTVAEDYWLRELLQHHAPALGTRAGNHASELLLSRVREVFEAANAKGMTWLTRPAVEDHQQNHSWDRVPNLFVEGARDVLLAWVSHDSASSRPFVRKLVTDPSEMVRRIAVFTINARWDHIGDLFAEVIGPALFDSNYLHEVYGLLRERFATLPGEIKAKVVQAIRDIPVPVRGEDPALVLRHVQRNWLSAIHGKGDRGADAWYLELNAESALGPLSTHPDFLSYMETWSGPGPTPYRAQELAAFAADGSVVGRLNDFRESGTWRGPTTRALVDALEEAVAENPVAFLPAVHGFIAARRPFQFGLISGFKKAWGSRKDQGLDWAIAWRTLMDLFEAIISSQGLWTEPDAETHDMRPTAKWIPPVIAEFLKAGTGDDERAYPAGLLPRGWALILELLAHAPAVAAPDDDAMTQAINSSKGKAVEALFSHALRVSRLADTSSGSHSSAWEQVRPAFDTELNKCNGGNFEFSTLAAAYVSQLDYMSSSWFRTNVKRIFPEREDSFLCAIAGLAYATIVRSVYGVLRDAGIVDRALKAELKGSHTREQLIKRIGLAYLWGDEHLGSGAFEYLFSMGRIDDLEHLAWYFWTVRDEELSAEQVERVLAFWEHCLEWGKERRDVEKLFGVLSLLASFVSVVDVRGLRLLLSAAPFAHLDHRGDFFVQQLERLADAHPEPVAKVLTSFLQKHVPPFDTDGRMRSLLMKLAQGGQRLAVIPLVDRVQDLPGMRELYAELVAAR